MDACPPDVSFRRDLHSSLRHPSIHLSFFATFLLVPCPTIHPSILPLSLPRVLLPLLHVLNSSHHLCSAFHPSLVSCLSLAVYFCLSPDIMSNHILKSSLQSFQHIHLSPSFLSSSLLSYRYYIKPITCTTYSTLTGISQGLDMCGNLSP